MTNETRSECKLLSDVSMGVAKAAAITRKQNPTKHHEVYRERPHEYPQ